MKLVPVRKSNQFTIPKEFADPLGIEEYVFLEVEIKEDTLVLRREDEGWLIRFRKFNKYRGQWVVFDNYNVSLVNTENLATTEFDSQLAVVFDIRLWSTNGNGKSPNVSQNRVNWTSTSADRILPSGNGGVLGSSKSMSKMRVNPYRDRAKSFYQRYDIKHDGYNTARNVR